MLNYWNAVLKCYSINYSLMHVNIKKTDTVDFDCEQKQIIFFTLEKKSLKII